MSTHETNIHVLSTIVFILICSMCEEVAKVLGLDWVLLFLQSDLHSTTVVWGLRILVAICSVQSILQKFKEGTSNGGWLRHTDHNKMALALGIYIYNFFVLVYIDIL